MQKKHLYSVFLALWLPAAVHADGALSFTSDPGDFVGGGQNVVQTFTDDEVWVSMSADGLLNFFKLSTNPQWILSLGTNNNSGLGSACYERAQREGLAGAGRPGLEFVYDQRGCNELSGRFKIIELASTPGTGEVTALAVDFVQHCESLGPALFGKVRYHSSVPLDTPTLEPVYASIGTLHFTSDPGDYVGQGQETSFQFDRLQFVTTTDYDNAVSATYLSDPGYTHRWNLNIAAPDSAPLIAGVYPNAERFPLQTAGHPGLSYGLDGRGCGQVSGQFSIENIVYEPVDHLPSALTASFEQHCENEVPALNGAMSFTTTFENGPLVDDVIHLDGFDWQPSWPLVWNCP